MSKNFIKLDFAVLETAMVGDFKAYLETLPAYERRYADCRHSSYLPRFLSARLGLAIRTSNETASYTNQSGGENYISLPKWMENYNKSIAGKFGSAKISPADAIAEL